ncbi:MAG TPA: SPFH domain-containing protein [Candidatus Paceibacterota bacterium]|nr:SPFH domain-containing protein [Candidatus Paceibacterota bacterium]
MEILFTLVTVLGWVAWAGAGIFAVLFLLPLIPHAVDRLTNDPNEYRPDDWNNELNYPPSRAGFFTYLQPGRVKIKERGQRFVDAIMAFEGHKFKGEKDNPLHRRDNAYWKVEETNLPGEGGYTDSHPIPFPGRKRGWFFFVWLLYSPISVLWWAWKRWTYWITGAIFTGIPPFQNIRVYPVERFKEITRPDGEVDFVRVEDYSDHYRVADFLYPIIIPKADTQDKIPVSIHVDLIERVTNPYDTAYNTDDDWTRRLLTTTSDAVTAFTRSHSLNAVLSAQDEDEARELADAIARTGKPAPAVDAKTTDGTTLDFGVMNVRVQIRDITPTNPAIGARLGDLAIARVDKDAQIERAKGQAALIRETGAALKEYPDATVIPQIEGTVRAAEAAGRNGGIVILGGAQIDPGQAALIREVRRLREGAET